MPELHLLDVLLKGFLDLVEVELNSVVLRILVVLNSYYYIVLDEDIGV